MDTASLNFVSVASSIFCLSDVITVTKAGTTVQVTVPDRYSSPRLLAVAGVSADWECKTSAEVLSGMKSYNAANFDLDTTKTGADRFTGSFVLSNENGVRGFSIAASGSDYVYTYTTQKDNEHIVFSGYDQNGNVDLTAAPYATLTYSYAGEGKTQVYTTEKPASEHAELTAEQLAMLNEAIERHGITDQAVVAVLREVASAFAYDGIAARVKIGAGIRSMYIVDHAVLNGLDATRVTYGAIMGVGEYSGTPINKTTDLAVAEDATKGYVATSQNSKAVVVYDSEGASYATNKYVYNSVDGRRSFAYTTTYGDTTFTVPYVRETQMVYRGFLAVTVGENTYILYADASGDTFGKEDATYGAATSLYEVSRYFRYEYTDPNSNEAIYADNVILKENIATAMDTAFTFTAADFSTADEDGSVVNGSSAYYAATDTTAETIVLASGAYELDPANSLTLTLNAAREGFYTVSFKGNTLGVQANFISWKSSAFTTDTSKLWWFSNSTRIAGSSSRKTSYKTALGDAYSETAAESYRVIPSLLETHNNVGEIYLLEGTNVVTFSLYTAATSPYLGISELTFTLKSELDVDKTEVSTHNGTALYADGYDNTTYSANGGTYPNTDTTMTLEKNKGAWTRVGTSNQTKANRIWYNFTIEEDDTYELFMAHGGAAGIYEILNEANEVIYAYDVPANARPHSTCATYLPMGETSLAKGSYTVRYTQTGNNYALIQGFFFSPTNEVVTPPAEPSTYKLAVHYVYANGQTASETFVSDYEEGATYSVESPTIPGYTPDVTTVSGTMTADREVTVTYTPVEVPEEPSTYKLTVHYVYEDGKTASETLVVEYEKGVSYSVESPVIPGYKPDVTAVSGTMTADREVTVTYSESRVTLTFVPVDTSGNPIGDISLGSTEVLAGNAYEYTLPAVDGFYLKETTVKGTAGYEDESIDVVLYSTRYTYLATDTEFSGIGTHVTATDTTMATVILGTNRVTFVFTPDVSGTYAVKGVVNTAGGRVDIRVDNNAALWPSKATFGRIAGATTATTPEQSAFYVANGTAETVLAYQYLEAGKENTITFSFTNVIYGSVGLASLAFDLVTPEFDATNDEIIPANTYTDKAATGVELSSSRSRIRNTGYLMFDLAIGATGIYDIHGLVGVGGVGTTTFLLTNKLTGKTTELTYKATGAVQIGGNSESTVDVLLCDDVMLYKGDYEVKLSTTSGYFQFAFLHFDFVSEIETGATANGEYAMAVEDKVITVNANYYPGFTRKAVTFSIDDGSATYDPILVELYNRYGFKATFNIYGNPTYSIYAGHEIANHGCHEDGIKTSSTSPYTLSTVLTKIKEQNDKLNTGIAANPSIDNDSVTSYVHPYTSGYRFLSDTVYTDETELSALAALFTAEGKTEYNVEKLAKMTEAEIYCAYLNAIGITSNRYATGYNAAGYAANGYDLPEDFMLWEPTMHQYMIKSSSADGYTNTYANGFRDLADDGKLKLFYAWGHGQEIVTEGDATGTKLAASALEAFLQMFAGDEYYKDTVSGIREYVGATRSLIVADGTILNPTDVAVYITVSVDGGEAERVVLGAGESYTVTFAETVVPVEDTALSYPTTLDLLEATNGYDATLVLQPSNALTFDLAAMEEGYYAVYAKLNATHGFIDAVTLQNKTATDFKTDALNAVETANNAWSNYSTGGRVYDYSGGSERHTYDSENLDQYRVAADNGYTLIGYQYLLSGQNTVSISIGGSTVGVSAFKFSTVAEIPSDAIHLLAGSYSKAEANGTSGFTVNASGAWVRDGATLEYTVNIPEDGEYKVYLLAGGNNVGVEVTDAAGWEFSTATTGANQLAGASQSAVAIVLPDTLMLAKGEATFTMTNTGGYGLYRLITLVRVGNYVEPESELNVRDFTHDLSSGTASATVSVLAPQIYGAVLAICDAEGNILGYDVLEKTYGVSTMTGKLSVALDNSTDIAAAASVKVFTVNEETLAEIETSVLSRQLAADFEYRTENGVRILIVSDEHYAIGSKTRVGAVTGTIYETVHTNSNNAGTDTVGHHNSYITDSELHLQAMIDAIKEEHKKAPIDAVMYLGDMSDMDHWYHYFNKQPDAYGVTSVDDLYKSNYDEIYYVKTEYYDQLKSFDSDGDGVKESSIPFFMTLGNHDLYRDEWFFDLTKPTADYKIGDVAEVVPGVSVCYVSKTDYVVLFDKNGEKDTAFGMVASHRTEGAALEAFLAASYGATIKHVGVYPELLQEMKDSVSEILAVSAEYKQVFLGCHMTSETYFAEFIESDNRIRAIFMGDSHAESGFEIEETGVYSINDGCFVHSFAKQYGFEYNFAAEPWGYVVLETHGTVSDSYRVNPAWQYDISRDYFFRYNDETIRATSYSDALSADILAMLNEKAGTSYTTLKDARNAGLVTTYKTEVDALAREEFLTRLKAAWTTLGLIDENTTDAEMAKMIRYDAESLDGLLIAQITHALMFAETVATLGEDSPGEIIKTEDRTLTYVVNYRIYEPFGLYRCEGVTPTVN